MKKPHILLTNDDGISAQGLRQLWKNLSPIAKISIVAPSQEKSGTGLGITCFQSLKVHEILWEDAETQAWSVSGTPADCVKMAVNKILNERPDMIVSGINRGSNAGRNALYSGTVGAAIEGSLQGIPSIAFSCFDPSNPNYEATRDISVKIVEHFLKEPLKDANPLNVNFPSKIHSQFKGVRLARQGLRFWKEKIQRDEGQDSAFWLGAQEQTFSNENAESDSILLEAGFVTVVPLHVNDLTHNKSFENLKKTFKI